MDKNSLKKKKVFISYCHTDVTEEWIENFVKILKRNGIDSIVDIYDLRLGEDKDYFMEQIRKVDNVLMLIGKDYKTKSDGREGGVGEETQLITPDVYRNVKQTKYIPIVIEKDEKGNAYLPYYLQSRFYADFSNENLYNQNLEKVLKHIDPEIETIIGKAEKTAVKVIRRFLESWVKSDFHNAEKRKDIEEIYQLYKESFNKYNCTSDIIEIGYQLTDIFERDKQYDKSLEIAKQLLGYYDLSEEREELFNKKYIRKIIGCAYSIAIAKVQDVEKEELLKEAKTLFDKMKKLCQNYYSSMANSLSDKELLWGLYYSDHGAYFLNEGDSNKKKQNDKEARQAYELALEEYKQSLEHRKILLGTIDGEDSVLIQEAKNMIARSISNMGVALFRLERYRESIEKHEEALKHFIELKDKDRECRTKEYIIGSFIELCQKDNDEWFLKDLRKCQKYLEELINYYGDVSNLKDKKNKLAEIEESFFKSEH